MSEPVGLVTKVLVAQAFALDDLFYRAVKEAFSSEAPSHYHARKALKAQERCRATFSVLAALRKSANTGKFSNLNGETIQTLKSIFPTNSLPKQEKVAAPTGAQRPKRRTLRSNRWIPEHRARQASAVREWQPWRTSTGPKTQDGKARSAANALKHGLRSKAFIEKRREDRRILASAADNLAILRHALAAAKTGVQNRRPPQRPAALHSIAIGPPAHALVPSVPANYRGIASPAASRCQWIRRAPRRRWRIAS